MRYGKLLEGVSTLAKNNKSFRRYSLSSIISESYKLLYSSEKGTRMYRLAEANLADVRENASDIDRLSKQLSNLIYLSSLLESGKLEDGDLLVPKEKHTPVEVKEEEVKESVDVEEEEEDILVEEDSSPYVWGDWQHERGNPNRVRFYSPSMDITDKLIGVVNEPGEKEIYTQYEAEIYDNSIADTVEGPSKFDTEEEAMSWVESWFRENESNDVDNGELTDEEVEELTKHLAEIRKNKKVSECDNKSVEESTVTTKPRKLARNIGESKGNKSCSKTYESLDLSDFSKNSSSKAFVKTFKKLHSKLKEGTALTRQESISLYKAANSAMTHLSVELEHNPEFLGTFRESVSLLSVDVEKLLGSLKEGKAPSKSTMKSLSKFSEALLREDEEEELPPIEDEEEEVISDETPEISEEEESFNQEYADARVELYKEIAEEHADDEDPAVQEKIEQDKQEVLNLEGITDEQVEEIIGEEVESEEETAEEPEEEEVEESVETTEEVDENEDTDLTDDEVEELKKHLKEMRSRKNCQK